MSNLDFSRYALSLSIAAPMLAGCGRSQLPIRAPANVGSSAVYADSAPQMYEH